MSVLGQADPCEGLEADFKPKASLSTEICLISRVVRNLRKGLPQK